VQSSSDSNSDNNSMSEQTKEINNNESNLTDEVVAYNRIMELEKLGVEIVLFAQNHCLRI
jgi:hypothetical protein